MISALSMVAKFLVGTFGTNRRLGAKLVKPSGTTVVQFEHPCCGASLRAAYRVCIIYK